MKHLLLSLFLLPNLVRADIHTDAKVLSYLLTEAGHAGHTCTTLISLNQPASVYCNRFRTLVTYINSFESKYPTPEYRTALYIELRSLGIFNLNTALYRIRIAAETLNIPYNPSS